MSDSGGGQNHFAGEVRQVAQEVIQDVKDQVGEVIEQGVQSITGQQQLTPQQIQQNEQKKQQRLAYVRSFLKKTESQIQQVREQKKQQEQQRLQAKQQEQQEAQIEEEKEKESTNNPALAFAGKPERKGGLGG